jgi:hypothetical protein
MAEFCPTCSEKYGFKVEPCNNEICEGCGKIFTVKSNALIWLIIIFIIIGLSDFLITL